MHRGEKAINDQEKVKNIFPYLDREDMKKVCEHLSQRENKIVNSFMVRFLSISSLDYYLYPEKYPALSETIKNQIITKIDDIIYLDQQTQKLKEQLDTQAVKEMRLHRKKAVKEIKNLLDGQKVSVDSLVAILGDMGNRANIKRVVILIKEYEKSHSREQKHE